MVGPPKRRGARENSPPSRRACRFDVILPHKSLLEVIVGGYMYPI